MTLGPAPDAAIRARITTELDETLFVEAGAGSGKTTALVDRIVALVAAGTGLDRIAAITFTEKAAAEFRDRVRIALVDAAAAASADPERMGRCTAALDDVDAAAIGTLHSFAQRLLREHAVEAGLPPTVDVMDEIESLVAFEARWSDFVEQLLADSALERTIVLAFALGIRLDHLAQVAADFGENWDLVAARVERHPPEPPSPAIGTILVEARRLVAALAHCCEDDDRLADYLVTLGQWCEQLGAVAGDEAAVVDELEHCPVLRTRRGRAGHWPGFDLDGLRLAVRAFAERPTEALAPVRDGCVRALAGAVAGFTLTAAEERRRHGRLEFHDLLVLARELLRGPAAPAVRRDLHRRYERILLDEFQDTDPIQLEIALRITAPPEPDADSWTGLYPLPGRLFVVGDPKQSIYRFRRADIASFLAAREHLADGVPAVLDANFRTTVPVVEWINEVFERLIVATPSAQPAYQPLRALRSHPAGAGPAVTVLGPDRHEGDLRADDVRALEAADVAGAIRTILAEGWQVADDADGWRAARPGDITILLPTRTSLALLQRALDAAVIPYRAESSSLVYATPEIRALLLAARAVDDPTDSLAVVSALRSSLFGCSDVDLFTWRQRGGSWHPNAPLPPRRAEGLDPAHDALACLAALVADRAWLAPSELLGRLVRERQVLELGVETGHPRDLWRRVRFVIDQARAWSEAGGVGLRGYLEWARRQSGTGVRAAEVVLPELDEDAVRIMTIHAAKGLEFPITIVSGLSTRPRGAPGGGRVIWTADGCEIRMGRDVTTDRYDEARDLDEQLDHYERVRLLYVACTRARDHLVVSCHRTAEADAASPGKATSAELLAWAAPATPVPWTDAPPAPPGPVDGAPPPAPWRWADRNEWQRERNRALEDAGRPRTVPATRLAEGDSAGVPDPGLAKGPRDLELPPWQKGRYGTAVGRAVHAVLQTVDLASGAGVDEAAAAQAAAEGVLGREGVVASLARSALASTVVRQAAGNEHWREVYVAAPIGDTLLEGYIDLLYRGPDGLVVVDYKTDHVPDDDRVAERLGHYRRQGAAYALAVERVTRERVARCVFVFCRPGPPIQRELADLPAAMAEIDADLGRGSRSGP